jgi:putative heme-binding domain-containing protein
VWGIFIFVERHSTLIAVALLSALFLQAALALASPQSSSLLSTYDLSNPSLIAQGEGLFAQNCAVGYCHGSAGRAGRGPRLRGREWDKNYLVKVTMEGVPNSSMPGWKDRLTEQEIASIIAYILTLSKASPDVQESHSVSAPTSTPQPAGSTTVPSPVPESSPLFSGETNGIVGDPMKGKLLFFDSSNEIGCGVCHKYKGVGSDVGPDLSKQKSRPARDIFKDILLPSAVMTTLRKPVKVTTRTGDTITGVLSEENPSDIKIFDLASLPAVLRTIPRDQVQSLRDESHSPMPDRYAEIYTIRQLLDLIAFLKDSDPKASPVRLIDLF